MNFTITTTGQYGQVKEAIINRMKNRDKELVVQTGSMAYTQSEWEKVLSSFDKAQESIQKNTQEQVEKLEELEELNRNGRKN